MDRNSRGQRVYSSIMNLVERVNEDIKKAMKAREKVRLNTLRMMKTELKRQEIDSGPLDEEAAVAVLIRLTKQRKDSIEQFQKAGREDLVETEKAELVIVEEYLPSAPDAEEMTAVVDRLITELGATSPREMGQVMKAAKEHFAGRPVDGRALSQLVRSRL